MGGNYGRMEMGMKCEELFRITFESLGYDVAKSSNYQDRKEHIDFVVTALFDEEPPIMWTVDVKSNRYRDKIWLEHTNVAGNGGWLQGKADYIAFHFPEENVFRFFYTYDLLDYVERHVTETTSNSYEFGKFYTRLNENKKDKIVKVRFEDIEDLMQLEVRAYEYRS